MIMSCEWRYSFIYGCHYHFVQRVIVQRVMAERSLCSHGDQKIDSYTAYFFWL